MIELQIKRSLQNFLDTIVIFIDDLSEKINNAKQLIIKSMNKYRNTNATNTTRAYNKNEIEDPTNNIYEAVSWC